MEKQIDRIVQKYPWNDSQELFRSELEDLVRQAKSETTDDLLSILSDTWELYSKPHRLFFNLRKKLEKYRHEELFLEQCAIDDTIQLLNEIVNTAGTWHWLRRATNAARRKKVNETVRAITQQQKNTYELPDRKVEE